MHTHTQPGYELWMLATQTSSTCQLVLWESQGLRSLFLSFQGLSMLSVTPPSPLHLLFLALPSPASPTHFIPTIIPPSIRSHSLSLSAPVTEKQTLSLPLPSCSLQTPGSHSITEKRQRLATRVHLCLVWMPSPVSDSQFWPNNGISEPQLQTDQSDSYISHSQFQCT